MDALSFHRWPLLWPVSLFVFALALVRTDLVAPAVAIIAIVLTGLILLWLRRFMLLVFYAAGLLVSLLSLWAGAESASYDPSWLDGVVRIQAVAAEVRHGPYYDRLLLKSIARMDTSGGTAQLKGNGLLYLYGKERFQSLMADDQIQVSVLWHPPRNYRNPGAFDYKTWCFDRHITLIGSARSPVLQVTQSDSGIEAARVRVRQAISAAPERMQGILLALLLGDRGLLNPQVNGAFAATGVAHILAISGMHVGLVGGWSFMLVWWLLTRREAWIVHWPVRVVATIAAIIMAACYAMLAGWPLPAVRSLVMLAAAAMAWLLVGRSERLNLLLLALFVILLFDPPAITSLSLWLSFMATAAIVMWVGHSVPAPVTWSLRLRAAVVSMLWVSVVATLATLPLIVTNFGQIPTYALPANLIVVPLYGFLVLPLALIGELSALLNLPDIAAWFMMLSGVVADFGFVLIEMLADLPMGRLFGIAPPLWISLLYALGLLLAGFLWFRHAERSAIVLTLASLSLLLTIALLEKAVSAPTMLVWDVGQGASSTLLLPGNRVVVVDVPGREGSRFNGGTQVAAGLRALGLKHVDVLVLSHAQSDHMGGALSLLNQVDDVEEIWLPDLTSVREDAGVQALLLEASRRSVKVSWLAAGMKLQVAGIDWQVLWPMKDGVSVDANNGSLVLRADMADRAILLPGDIENEAEQALVAFGIEPVSVLLMPHHGSRTSSHAAFIDALRPEFAIAQTGWKNRFHFPAPEVVVRYRDAGAETANSADGCLRLIWRDGDERLQPDRCEVHQPGRRELLLSWLKN